MCLARMVRISNLSLLAIVVACSRMHVIVGWDLPLERLMMIPLQTCVCCTMRVMCWGLRRS